MKLPGPCKRSSYWRSKAKSPSKRATGRLAEEMQGVLDLTPNAVLLVGEDQIIHFANRSVSNIFGYRINELVDQPLDILVPERYQDAHRRQIQAFSDSNETTLRMEHRQEIYARHKSGREFACGISLAKMHRFGAQYYLVIVHDLSHRQQVEEALRIQGQIIDQIHDAVVSTDLDGYVTSWNKGAEYLFDYRSAEAIGRHISFVYEEHLHDFLENGIIAPLKAKGRHEAEVRMIKKSGEPFEAHLALSLLRDSRGKVVGMIGYSMDITERKNAENRNKQLLEAERKARQTVEKLRQATVALARKLDRKYILETLLTYLEDMVPMESASVSFLEREKLTVVAARGNPRLGSEVGEVVTEMEKDRFKEIAAAHDALIRPWRTVSNPNHREQAEINRSWMGLPILIHEQVRGYLELISFEEKEFDQVQAALVQALVHQAAVALENAQLFEQVRISEAQIKKMARELVSAQEKERRRIARDLHDDAGQSLIALLINLHLIRLDLPQDLEVARENLADAEKMTKNTMQKLRLLTHDLRPPELDALGLNPVLKDMCQSLEQHTHIAIEYQGEELKQLPEIVTISLYRVLQEALTNVIKHSGATHVQVILGSDEQALALSVKDNGSGFDDADLARATDKGIGLIGIRERLELIGGRLEIRTHPGTGTLLIAKIPWKEIR
jgi:PAS domain S-box-containing protein